MGEHSFCFQVKYDEMIGVGIEHFCKQNETHILALRFGQYESVQWWSVEVT